MARAYITAAVRSLIALWAMLSLFFSYSQAAPANDTWNPVQRSTSTAPPQDRFYPDLVAGLTANSASTAGRVVDSTNTPDGKALWLASGPQQTDLSEPADLAGYCAALAGRGEYSMALAKICEFALSVPKKLPDVICEQKTTRTGDINHSDVITAQVTYRDGGEYDSDVRVDGKPADASAPWSSGAWSIGEFAVSLNTIFMPSSKPEFRYRKEEKLHGDRAVVFDFHVLAENNTLYRLRSGGKEWFPEYSGSLWLDKTDFRLLRLERETREMPSEPITRMKTATDYSLVALGDGTSMVLPVHANVLICTLPFNTCARNIVTFTKWQKFRATTNIILNPN
jgi:hypothetical protein